MSNQPAVIDKTMCFKQGKKQEKEGVGGGQSSPGRRVIPNLHSQELFKKINFYKYLSDDEKQSRFPWLNSKRAKSAKVGDDQAAVEF